MRIMTRVGDEVLKKLGAGGDFIPCLHSVGAPLKPGQAGRSLAVRARPQQEIHRPFPRGPVDLVLRLRLRRQRACSARNVSPCASPPCVAQREGWMAEHMLILCLTSPAGKKYYVAAAFPSACGKTNLAMMQPTLPGWKVTTLGDDIAWIRVRQGRPALCDESRKPVSSASRPGTSEKSNPQRHDRLREEHHLHQRGATPNGDVWWEDMGVPAPAKGLTGKARTGRRTAAAKPRIRIPVSPRPAAQCPVIDPDWENPEGVPISAILFGGRRPSTIPLVNEAFDWEHGVFMGSACGSETTAAALGKAGVLRRDPFAMLPFCGYNMGDYFAHWLSFARRTDRAKLPKIYFVNWFRKSADGKWLWPGYGENSRVLKWICERVEGTGKALKTPIGNLPTPDALDLDWPGCMTANEITSCSPWMRPDGKAKSPTSPATTKSLAPNCPPL